MPVLGTIAKSGVSIPFLAVLTEKGFVEELSLEVPEELLTPGVNGRRWRTLYKQFPSFTLVTITEASTYQAAASLRNRMNKLINQLVQLLITVNGSNYSFKDVHVDAVSPVAVPGPVVASGSSGGLAHVACLWSVTLTDFNQSAQAGS